MTSYDNEFVILNKDKIEMIIDGFLHNLRLIGNLIIEVAKNAIDNDKIDPEGNLLNEDEKKCSEREQIERDIWIELETNGRELTTYEINDIRRESNTKFYKLRFPEILEKLKKYIRLSHILDIGGYDFSKFFELESDEPLDETLIRQSITEEKRIKLRHSVLCKFIHYSHSHWSNIKSKNISYLVNHLSTLFPDSEFTDKLEIIFGNNDSHKKYINEENLERVWKLIHACIKTSIKYMKYLNKSVYNEKKMINDKMEIIRIVTVDIEEEILNWNVNWLEVRPVRK